MRHMMLMHGAAGGLAGLVIRHVFRRIMGFVLFGLVAVAIIYWFNRRRTRPPNRMSEW